MNTFLRLVSTGLLVVCASSTTFGQGMQMALLDVGYIFKNHPQFKRDMDAMKASVQQFEAGLKASQEKIQNASKQISSYKAGSPEYKKIESDTTKALANLKVSTQLKRKEIMEQEAKIYLATYKQVEAAVAQYAQQMKIDLVFRYDREANPQSSTGNPQETLKIINRPVIYHDKLDISDAILAKFGGVAQRTATGATRQ